jgi:hypothetical protein
MDTRIGCKAAPDEERWLFVGKDLCCPPSPEPWGDPGALFDEVERVALLKVTALTARHPYCIQPRHGKAMDAEALISQGSKPSRSDDDGGLSKSDSEPDSDGGGWLSEAEQDPSSTRKQSRWSGLEKQRLLAYKNEGKPWPWIFRKFPGRTHPAIRTRWNMIRPRDK